MKNKKKRILFIVRAGKKYGIGHLKRCLNFSNYTKNAGYSNTFLIVTSNSKQQENLAEWTKLKQANLISKSQLISKLKEIIKVGFDSAVIDGREMPANLIYTLSVAGIPIISLDDYGLAAKTAEVNAQLLPYFGDKFANFTDLALNPLDPKIEALTKQETTHGQNALVSFGGSDPAAIARKTVEALLKLKIPVLLIEGPLANYDWAKNMKGVKVISCPASLAEYYSQSNRVFTTVGITMIEALRLGKLVFTVNPTLYHERVARKLREPVNIGLAKKVNTDTIEAAVRTVGLNRAVKISGRSPEKWFISLIENLYVQKNAICPVCGSIRRSAIARDSSATLFKCRTCGSNYRYELSNRTEQYTEDYYQQKYSDTYGKTYEQDIENISKMSIRRLQILKNLTSVENASLLDVGSALGVFVNQAHKQGFKAVGLEISDYARRFAEQKFGVECYSNRDQIDHTFDVITFWYSLEHLDDPLSWLRWANRHLVNRGVLGLAIPHSEGAFARFNHADYVKARPIEHRFEPSIYGMKLLLKKTGFRIQRLVIGGLHPQRIGLPDWELFRILERHLKLGDTFELYAIKIHSSD